VFRLALSSPELSASPLQARHVAGNLSIASAADSVTPASTPGLSAVSCGKKSMTGPGKEACSVYLSARAPGRLVVSLSSNNAAVKVPAAVTVSPGATSTGFAAIVSSVNSTQDVTLTASSGGVSRYFQL
jgi:hypothetical protein